MSKRRRRAGDPAAQAQALESGGTRRRRDRQPSTDELALWQKAMRDTAPLEGRDAEPATVPVAVTPVKATPVDATPASPPPEPARQVVPSIQAQTISQPAAHGIDRRTLQRLKRGLVQIDARLDLHGMTQDEAHRHLTLFLAHHQRQGARCLLVITGVGGRSGGILRQMTPRWLASAPNAQRVIAHAPAQRRHGGEGALYVLLRRLR